MSRALVTQFSQFSKMLGTKVIINKEELKAMRERAIAKQQKINDPAKDAEWLQSQQDIIHKLIQKKVKLAMGNLIVINYENMTPKRRRNLLENWLDIVDLSYTVNGNQLDIWLDFLAELDPDTNARRFYETESRKSLDKSSQNISGHSSDSFSSDDHAMVGKDRDQIPDQIDFGFRGTKSLGNSNSQLPSIVSISDPTIINNVMAAAQSSPRARKTSSSKLLSIPSSPLSASPLVPKQLSRSRIVEGLNRKLSDMSKPSWTVNDQKWLEAAQMHVIKQFQAHVQSCAQNWCHVMITNTSADRNRRLIAWLEELGFDDCALTSSILDDEYFHVRCTINQNFHAIMRELSQ